MIDHVPSRQDDETPMRCEDCGWQGPVKECHWNSHNHKEFEPDVFCPKCDSNDIEEAHLNRRPIYFLLSPMI